MGLVENIMIWRSSEPWKTGLLMKDPYYLPVPGIFALFQIPGRSDPVIADYLSLRGNLIPPIGFNGSQVLHDLNSRKDPNRSLRQLVTACDGDGDPQACLILGRIYEFGAYNQTQDHEKALNYYERLHGTASLSPLSFFHRHSLGFPLSIVEADSTMEFIESALPAALQHEHGFLRPLSCPATSRILFPIAKAVTEMTLDLISSPLNASQAAALAGSTDPADLHALAMYELSAPYPAVNVMETAKARLLKALEQGHQESAAPLAALARQMLNINITRVLGLLDGAINLRDPAALHVASGFFLIPQLQELFNPARGLGNLRAAATLGYAPAIHKLGEITYYGFFGIGRSNSKAFKLFNQAAVSGYRPSILRAARLLLDGDGVVVDCPRAVSMLKRVIDGGPWRSFLDTYQEVGSRHAFMKMLDMNLTPCGWLDVGPGSQVTDELLKVVGRKSPGPTMMTKIRASQEGDGAALLWLTLRSPLIEALEWLKRVELMPPAISIFAVPLKWILIARAIIGYRGLDQREADIVSELLTPVGTAGLIVTAALCLILLIVLRVSWTFR
jgi:TPR repeat protein